VVPGAAVKERDGDDGEEGGGAGWLGSQAR
jgi:hypothetical protein